MLAALAIGLITARQLRSVGAIPDILEIATNASPVPIPSRGKCATLITESGAGL